jgi:hypothetical protein
MVLRRDCQLSEIVRALDAVGCLTHLLDGRQEQGDEHADDRDHYEQLDQREATPEEQN